jgi:hypothetical protein
MQRPFCFKKDTLTRDVKLQAARLEGGKFSDPSKIKSLYLQGFVPHRELWSGRWFSALLTKPEKIPLD